MRRGARAASLVVAALLAGCGSGNVGRLPTQQIVDPAKNGVLQFGTGIATINYNGRVLTAGGRNSSCYPNTVSGPPYFGVNFVESFRQPNGLAAALYDRPHITGPAGFVGDSDVSSGQVGAASNAIYKAFQLGGGKGLAQAPQPDPLLQDLGGFGFGFGAETSGVGAPVFGVPTLPSFDFDLGTCTPYFGLTPYGGPPAWPTAPGGFPVGEGGGGGSLFNAFPGYPLGFLTYLSAAKIPTGAYTLDLQIPTGTGVEDVTAVATLKPHPALPVFDTPSVSADAAHPGGLLIDVNVPAGLTEAFVEIQPPVLGFVNNYSIAVPVNTPGRVRVVLPPRLGAPVVNSSAPTPSLNPGDMVAVYALGFDYDVFGASYPGNRSQRPTLTGPGGSADVTISDAATFTYP